MSLEHIQADDLVGRWNMIIEDYLSGVKELNGHLIKLNKLRKELVIIREELASRDIDVDQPLEEVVDCPEGQQKT